MKNKIAISTGLLYKFTENRDEMVNTLKKYNPEGIEFCLAFSKYVSDFQLNTENLEYIRGLKRVSIHGPWDISYGQNSETQNLLGKLKELSNQLQSANTNFDAEDINDFGPLDKSKLKITIENGDSRKNKYKTPNEFKNIFSRYPKLNFNLDIAHAFDVDKNLIPEFLSFKNIAQIHLSYHDETRKDHGFLHRLPGRQLMHVKKVLMMINPEIPLVLEAVASEEKEIYWINDEIDFLRTI